MCSLDPGKICEKHLYERSQPDMSVKFKVFKVCSGETLTDSVMAKCCGCNKIFEKRRLRYLKTNPTSSQLGSHLFYCSDCLETEPTEWKKCSNCGSSGEIVLFHYQDAMMFQ